MKLDNDADLITERYERDSNALIITALNRNITKTEFSKQWASLADAAALQAFMIAGGDTDNPKAKKELAAHAKTNKRSSKILASDIYSGKYDESDEDN